MEKKFVALTGEGLGKMVEQCVIFIGTRGLPAEYGGFETFVEKMSAELSARGYRPHVIGDKDSKNQLPDALREGGNVFCHASKYSKSKSPFLFYWDSLRIAGTLNGLIYCCGVGGGPAQMILSSDVRSRLWINVDGVEWKRTKWSAFGRFFIKALFWMATRRCKGIIFDSPGLIAPMRKLLPDNVRSTVLPYGAEPITDENAASVEMLGDYELGDGEYHLIVARIEPENNVFEIVEGYSSRKRRYPLVIVGPDKQGQYDNKIRQIAQSNPDVIWVGGVYDQKRLARLRLSAYSYFHGHSVGGTNPSLLEAMAARSLRVAHKNPFNSEVLDKSAVYFGDSIGAGAAFDRIEAMSVEERSAYSSGAYVRWQRHYTWPKIAELYDNWLRSI